MKFDARRYHSLKPATTIKGFPPEVKRRVETAIDAETGKQVFVLDRREVLSPEDGFSLSLGIERLPAEISNIRRH